VGGFGKRGKFLPRDRGGKKERESIFNPNLFKEKSLGKSEKEKEEASDSSGEGGKKKPIFGGIVCIHERKKAVDTLSTIRAGKEKPAKVEPLFYPRKKGDVEGARRDGETGREKERGGGGLCTPAEKKKGKKAGSDLNSPRKEAVAPVKGKKEGSIPWTGEEKEGLHSFPGKVKLLAREKR